MAQPDKSDVAAAQALGNAVDAAVQRYIKAPTPKNAKQLQRAITVIYLSGVQQATSTILAGASPNHSRKVAEQLNRAVEMVATSLGFTKSSGREDGGDISRLILPG